MNIRVALCIAALALALGIGAFAQTASSFHHTNIVAEGDGGKTGVGG
jgi:hypothetical protein